MSSSLPSSSNSRSSTVQSLSGKTQGLKFMQRAGLKKNPDSPSTSKIETSSTNNDDFLANTSVQSNSSYSIPGSDASEQWSIPSNKAQPLNQKSRFQPEQAWDSWHLSSHNHEDEDSDEDNIKGEDGATSEKAQTENGFDFVSDNYRPSIGKRRKRYGDWAVQRKKKARKSDGDEDDDEDSGLDESRVPKLDEGEDEERERKSGKKNKKESKNLQSSSKKFLKPGGSENGIKKKSSKDLLPSGARKSKSKSQSKISSSSSMGEFEAQQIERNSVRDQKREKLSKGKQAAARRSEGFRVPDMREQDDDDHYESRKLDSGGL